MAAAGNGNQSFDDPKFNNTGLQKDCGAIVAGAAACLQGVTKARGQTLTPARVRKILVDTGTPQSTCQSTTNRHYKIMFTESCLSFGPTASP